MAEAPHTVEAVTSDYQPALGRAKPFIPRGRQLAIMSILWQRGSGTITQIQDDLGENEEPEISNQSAQTYVSALRRYGWVRSERVGRALRYFPTLSIVMVRHTAVDYITDRLYHAAPAELLIDVIERRSTPAAVLPKVRAALERRLAATAAPSDAGERYRSTGRMTREACAAER